ncbi:hypothetical protein CJF30_00001280 [Rutstroemia sp. NJR-2017a BBW]|nr:hypothetical protein CJF30_00001280 [Rutstroemia sp. NJR-2017a BBW]
MEVMVDLSVHPQLGRTCVLQETSLAQKAGFPVEPNISAETAARLLSEIRMLKGAVFTSAAHQESVAMESFNCHPACKFGLDHVEPGDVVAVLIGSQVPFILQRAYVDEIMDCEAMVRREIVGVLELLLNAAESIVVVSYH